MVERITRYTQLQVFQRSFDAAMRVFEFSKRFPQAETYSLTDQIRRSSRSVSANIAEAWRKRRYEAAFIAKLSDSEAEVAETQTWLQFAVECQYLTPEETREVYREYDELLSMLVAMIHNPADWTIPKSPTTPSAPRK